MKYRTQGHALRVTLWGKVYRQVPLGAALREGDIFRGDGNRWYRTLVAGDIVGRDTSLEVYYRAVKKGGRA